LRITHFSETTEDINLIFSMGGDANVKLCNQYFFIPGAQPHPAVESVLKNVTEIPTLNHIYL
jgi:hypothetical protein